MVSGLDAILATIMGAMIAWFGGYWVGGRRKVDVNMCKLRHEEDSKILKACFEKFDQKLTLIEKSINFRLDRLEKEIKSSNGTCKDTKQQMIELMKQLQNVPKR